MAKTPRPYKRPTRRLRRSGGKRKSFAERLRERQPESGLRSEFRSFLGAVAVKPPSKAETDAARNQIKRLRADLDKPETTLKRIREIYDQMAGHYFKITNRERIGQEICMISGHVNIKPNACIASLGSGPGIMEAFFAKKIVPQGRVTCVDISPEMNKIAERIKANAKAENMEIITGSGAATGLPTSSQDLVIAAQTNLVRSVHWQPLLKEVKRILRKGPNTRFVVSFATENRAHAKEVVQSLERNHFKTTTIKYAETGKQEAIMVIAQYSLI